MTSLAVPIPRRTHWADIPGWFDWAPFYQMVLDRTPDDGVIIECGVFLGRSIAYLASKAEEQDHRAKIIGYDLWCIEEDEAGRQMTSEIRKAIEKHGSLEQAARAHLAGRDVLLVKGDAIYAARDHGDKTVDAVFLDDCHLEDHVLVEMLAWWPRLKPGGFLAGHDLDMDGVSKAVSKFSGKKGLEVLSDWPRTWWVQK